MVLEKGGLLVCFDMDGVLFRERNFWLRLHERFGTLEQGRALTDEYLHTDYERLVKEVVAKLWKGKDAQPYYTLIDELRYTDGAEELFAHLRRLGAVTAIVSTSSIDLARRVQRELGVDEIFANELVIEDGRVAGEFHWPLGAGGEEKARVVRELSGRHRVALDNTIFIGDGTVDLDAMRLVGTSIAFSADEDVREEATHVVDTGSLADVIPLIEGRSA